MADLKPLGSEKLHGDEKLKRILELTYYNEKKNKSISTKPELIKESSTGGVYGIVKEKDGYYVKRGLNEQSLDYIGGMFMKNKNKFSSYSEALKRLEFIKGQEELQEATKYILKPNKPQEAAPDKGSDVPPPTTAPDMGTEASPPAESDMASEPAPDMGGEPAPDMGGEPAPDMGGEPAPDMGGEPAPDMGGEESSGSGESKRSDYMAEVQKFAGKLGQELRDQKERLESDDIKYVLNMVISAVDLEKLDLEDLEEIGKKFERENEEGGEDMGSEEPEKPAAEEPASSEEPSAEENLGEKDGLKSLEELINTPLQTHEVNIDQFDDLSEGDDQDDIKEVDFEKMKNEINQAIGEKLSKYFN